MNKISRQFNVRVYILVQSEKGEVLVSDEIIQGKYYSKFPGGGLEWGESTLECATREALEELNQSVSVGDHFYTSDIFIQSWFNESHQIIAVYYNARLNSEAHFQVSANRFDFDQHPGVTQLFRWVAIDELDVEQFDFPADKEVVKRLKASVVHLNF